MKKTFLLWFTLWLCSFNYGQKTDTLQLVEKPKFETKKLYVPVGLMATGILSEGNINTQIKDWRNNNHPNFNNHADDYLQFAPHVAVYAMEFAGMKPKTDLKNQIAIHIKGELLTLGMTYILKKLVNNTRPDRTSMSFPSGHTANAFAGATILSMEYQENYHWVPCVAYGTASLVGGMRILNNRHYLSDVLFGAGLGILSMKLAYWTHQYKWNLPKSEKDPLTILYQK